MCEHGIVKNEINRIYSRGILSYVREQYVSCVLEIPSLRMFEKLECYLILLTNYSKNTAEY